jgi:hypothetical protein
MRCHRGVGERGQPDGETGLVSLQPHRPWIASDAINGQGNWIAGKAKGI